MILMQAPGPDMTFAGMPSGSTYVSNQYAMIMITNDSVDDQTALAAAGCFTLSPFGGWGTFSFATLADLYAADTGAILPGITGFPQHVTCQVMADTTLANNGTWYKTGTGNGAGNWSFTNALLTSGAAGAAAAALAANASAIAAAISATSASGDATISTTQAGIATTQAAAAATSAQVAQAAANATGILLSATSAGASPPYKVSAITVSAAGTATSNGRFNGGASGLSGFTWSYLASTTGGISAPMWPEKQVLSTSSTAPTLTASAGGVSGATATATMSQLANGETFWALSSDGQSQLLWQVSGGVVAAVNGPSGFQVQEYLKGGIDAVISGLNITQVLGGPEFALTYKGDKTKWLKITPTQFLHPVIDAISSAITALQSSISSFQAAAQRLTYRVGPDEFSLFYANDKTRWFRLTPTAMQHPVIDSLVNAVGANSTKSTYTVRDSKWDSIQLVGETPHFEGYGQSLMQGYPGPTYSPNAANFAYMFSGGVRPDDLSTDPAVIYAGLVAMQERAVSSMADPTANSNGSVGETPMMGAMQMLAQLLRDNDSTDPATNGQRFLASVSARGGATAALLTKANGTRYPRLLANLQNGPLAAAATGGKSYASGGLFYTQGESDALAKADPATWTSTVLGIQASVQSDWQAAAGNSRPVPMLMYQTSSSAGASYYNGAQPDIPLAQLQMALNNDYVAHVTPTFFMQHRTNDVHLQPAGTKYLGAYYGWVIYQWLYKGYKPAPLRPVIRAEGNQIIARYPVLPGRKLVIDSSTIELMPNFGMRAFNSAGVEKALSNPRLVGRDCVVWTASETPADVWQFGYAWSSQTATGRVGLNGGNIRDDNPLIFDPTDLAKPMYRWAPIDKIALTA